MSLTEFEKTCQWVIIRGLNDISPKIRFKCLNEGHYKKMSCCGEKIHIPDAMHGDYPPRGCLNCVPECFGYPMQCKDKMCACQFNPIVMNWFIDDDDNK